MLEWVEGLEHSFVPFVQLLRLLIEAIAAFWLLVGVAYAAGNLVSEHLHRTHQTFHSIRLRFSRYLSLALEFQLAADILSTAIAPTFDELGRLAIIAVIRTGLNYFLSKEMKEESTEAIHEPDSRPGKVVADAVMHPIAPPVVRA